MSRRKEGVEHSKKVILSLIKYQKQIFDKDRNLKTSWLHN